MPTPAVAVTTPTPPSKAVPNANLRNARRTRRRAFRRFAFATALLGGVAVAVIVAAAFYRRRAKRSAALHVASASN